MKNLVLAISGVILLLSCKKEINSGTLKSNSNESAVENVEAINAVASLSYYYPQEYRKANSGDRKVVYADSVFTSRSTWFKGLKFSVHNAQPVGLVNLKLTIDGNNTNATYTVANDTITVVPNVPVLVSEKSWYSLRANISGATLTTYYIAWNELLLTKTLEDSNFIPVENVSMTFGLPCSPTEFR